jgi:hypothetical protein
VLSHTVYKPGGVTETSHRCLSSYHDLQVSRLCYIIVACPLTTTSRASQLHTDMVCKCVNVSGETVLEQVLDPDRWAVQSLHVLDDGGVALQHKWGPDCKACLMCTCSSPMWAVHRAPHPYRRNSKIRVTAWVLARTGMVREAIRVEPSGKPCTRPSTGQS